jgi:hypothetical protein
MNRRDFLKTSSATLFSALVVGAAGMPRLATMDENPLWMKRDPLTAADPAPLPEITAIVNIMVPADPLIPGDFKGSDYYGDWVLAATLGEAGQIMTVLILNNYAQKLHGKTFINCTADEQMDALKQWVQERETYPDEINQMLTGVLTISVVGTYEVEDPVLNREVFTLMGWFDPNDPDGTMRNPCSGYVDANIYPVRLKKGFTS